MLFEFGMSGASVGTQPSRLILTVLSCISNLLLWDFVAVWFVLLYHKHGDSDAVTVSLW